MPLETELRYDDARAIGESFRADACVTTEEGWMRVDAVIGRGDVVLPYRRAGFDIHPTKAAALLSVANREV